MSFGANEYIKFVCALRRGTGIKQAQAAYENFLRLIGRSEEQIAEAVRHIKKSYLGIVKEDLIKELRAIQEIFSQYPIKISH